MGAASRSPRRRSSVCARGQRRTPRAGSVGLAGKNFLWSFVSCLARDMLLGARPLVIIFAVATGLYEAPPGGCKIPEGYDDAISQPSLPRPRPKPSPPPPKPTEPVLSEDEVQEKLERELYERESMQQLSGLGEEEDWDAVEREHQRELAMRELMKKIALVLVVAYALNQAVSYVKRNLAAAKEGGAQPTGEVSTPTKGSTAAAAAAPAATHTDDHAEPAAAEPPAAEEAEDGEEEDDGVVVGRVDEEDEVDDDEEDDEDDDVKTASKKVD